MGTIFKGLPYYLEISSKDGLPLGEVSAALYHKSSKKSYEAIITEDENNKVLATWNAEQTSEMKPATYALDIIQQDTHMVYHSDEFAKVVVSSRDFT